MTQRTVTPQAQSSPTAALVSASLARGLATLEQGTIAMLVTTVVGFGVWTLAYQVALLTHLGSTVTLALAVIIGAPVVVAVLPAFVHSPVQELATSLRGGELATGVAVATVVVALGATGRRGLMMGVLVLGAAVWVGLALWRRRGPSPSPTPASSRQGEAGLWLVAWFWALSCAGLSTVIARPDGDDAYFINLVQWVADRGTFPTRDTMLGDGQFPALSSHRPPIHSIEGLMGAVAHVVGMRGGELSYVVATPALTTVAVLALAWLISVSRVPFAPLALTASVVFLLASGGSGASFGNFFALRMWQGKAMLATLVLPLLCAVAITYVERGGWRRQVVLALAVVCTVGASNTAVFLVPVLVAAVVLAAFVRAGPRRAAGAAVILVYPLACGVAVRLVARATSTAAAVSGEGGTSSRLNPLLAVPGRHGLFLITMLAVSLGWLGLRSVAARAVSVSLVLVAGLALLPPLTHLLVSAAGVGAVIWRMWWVIPVPLLVAGLVGAVTQSAARWVPAQAVPVVAVATALVAGLVPLSGGRWIFDHRNGVRFVSPLEWKLPVHAEAGARAALRVSHQGDVVLAPWDTSRALATMSVDVHPVSARSIYCAPTTAFQTRMCPSASPFSGSPTPPRRHRRVFDRSSTCSVSTPPACPGSEAEPSQHCETSVSRQSGGPVTWSAYVDRGPNPRAHATQTQVRRFEQVPRWPLPAAARQRRAVAPWPR